MLYMVIEQFRSPDGVEVYRRFRERGRMAPRGLEYLGSWVHVETGRCFQLMETSEPALLDEWAANWRDLVDFEFVPVITGQEMAERARVRSHP